MKVSIFAQALATCIGVYVARIRTGKVELEPEMDDRGRNVL